MQCSLLRPAVTIVLPDAVQQPTLSIPEAGALLAGLNPSQSYAVWNRNADLPVIELSPNRRVVPTAALLRLLGVEDGAEASTAQLLDDARGELEEACDAADRAAADHLAAVGRLREAVAVVRALSRAPAPELRAVR